MTGSSWRPAAGGGAVARAWWRRSARRAPVPAQLEERRRKSRRRPTGRPARCAAARALRMEKAACGAEGTRRARHTMSPLVQSSRVVANAKSRRLINATPDARARTHGPLWVACARGNDNRRARARLLRPSAFAYRQTATAHTCACGGRAEWSAGPQGGPDEARIAPRACIAFVRKNVSRL